MARDKEETKAKILAAVGKLLAESGFQQLGVNAIAREAGVDKVLIYRYFENLPSLLHTFAKEGDYWITTEALIANEATVDVESLANCMSHLLGVFLNDFKERPVTQEIMRWELLEGNELTGELANVRDNVALESLNFLKQKFKFPEDTDIPAISAVLIAGVIYLVLRNKVSKTFMGLDFSSPTTWQRVESAIESLIKSTVKDNYS